MLHDPRNGLTLSVLRNASRVDCTAGGVTSRCETLTVVGHLDSRTEHANDVQPLPEGSRVHPPVPGSPAVAVEVRNIGGPVLTLVPVTWEEHHGRYVRTGWAMAGGNYAGTSDSRFGQLLRSLAGESAVGYAALSVHDRIEN